MSAPPAANYAEGSYSAIETKQDALCSVAARLRKNPKRRAVSTKPSGLSGVRRL